MHEIRSSREYHEVYSNHQKLHGTLFTFLYRKTTASHRAVGIVVSRKTGKAVRRNKVKRRVKAYLREHLEKLPDVKLVIIARDKAGEATWQETVKDLEEGLRLIN